MDKRGTLLVLVFCFVFVLACGFVSAYTNVSSCTALTTAGELYKLNTSIGSGGTCLNISNHHIVVDCQNNWINFSGEHKFGVNVSSGFNNITIRNCKINNTNTSLLGGFGIFFNNSDNNTVEYCNFSHGKAGIVAINSSNTTIQHNYGSGLSYGPATVWTTCSPFNDTTPYRYYETGIWLVESNNCTIYNNTIYGDGAEAGVLNHNGTEAGITLCKTNYTNITRNNLYYLDTFGFIFSQSHHNDFFYNIINGSNASSSHNTNDGIIVGGPSGDVDSGACNNNNLSHNEFYDCSEWGIFLTGSNNNTIYNNTANSNGVGIRIGGTSSSNKLYENIVNSNTDYGVGIEGNYNEVINITISSNTQKGINIADATAGYCHDNIIINAEIDSSIFGIYLSVDNLGGCQNITIKDSIITNSGTNDIYAVEGIEAVTTLNSTFLNVSLDKTSIHFSPDINNGALYFKWYVDVATNYTNGSAGNGATVNAYNKNNALKFTDTVAADSYITRQNVTEFYQTIGGATYLTNYGVNATIADYYSETESVNITTNMIGSNEIRLLLRNCGCASSTFNYTCGETITESCTMNCDLNATGTCFTIIAHDLVVDGAGYNIDGEDSGVHGVGLSGYDNITIKNINITDFPSGIKYTNSDNGSIINVTIKSCASAISLATSSNINITNCTTESNSAEGITITGGANHTVKNNLFNLSKIEGIYVSAFGKGNLFINNTIHSSSKGIFIGGLDNVGINNSLYNNTRGIELAASNNTFIGGIINLSTYAVDIEGACDGNLIRDLKIINSSIDVYLKDPKTEEINLTFLNVTFNKSNTDIEADMILYVKWYIDVFVNYSNGSIAPGASVKAYDTNNALEFTDTTGATSYITRQNVTEYYENSTNKFYLTNYSMNATINPISATKQVNFTGNLIDDDNVTLTIDNTNPVPTLTIVPSSIVLEGSTTINCSGTDTGGTGLSSVIVSSSENSSICSNNSCSGSSTCTCQADSYTPTYVGTHAITCLITDNSANTDTAVGNLEVIAAGGGGGGGGGGVEPPVQPEPEEPYCGDGTCEAPDETCENCPEDCGYVLCSSFISGTGFCCSGLEQNIIYDLACYTSTGSCSGCETTGSKVCTNCGNGLCESCENYCNCPGDCEQCENIWLEVEMIFGQDEGIYIPIITPIIQPIINPIQRGLGM